MKKSQKLLSVILIIMILITSVSIASSAATLSESESNNTYATADTLSLNSSIKGKMDDGSDADFYKITATSNGKLSITFKHDYEDKGGSWKVTLYYFANNTYNELSYKEIGLRDSGIIEFPFVGTVAKGIYYVKVSNGFYNTIGSVYEISSSFSTTEYSERELNNSYQTANTISPNKEYCGVMNSGSDADFYKITATSNGKLSITFKHNYEDKDNSWKVTLYYFANNTYNELSYKEIGLRDSGKIELPFVGTVANGVYYIKVSNGFYSPIGSEYEITSSFVSTEYAERELNNSYQTANTISPNKEYCGVMNSGSDADFYKITATSNGKLSITFKHNYEDKDNSWKVTLYYFANNTYNELSYKEIGLRDAGEIELPFIGTVANGVYYIKVSNGFYSPIGSEYEITSSFVSTEYAERELNNSYQTANNISLNREYCGVMNSGSDEDDYKLTATSAGSIPITFNHKTLDNSCSWYVKIYNYKSGTYEELYNGTVYCNDAVESKVIYTISAVSNGVYIIKITNGFYNPIGYEYSFFAGKKTAPTTKYTVTYNANGGSVSPSSASIEAGSSVTLPTPTKKYTITYSANGGSGAPSSQTVSVTCKGWSTSSTASSASYSCGSSFKPTANTTLYAVWNSSASTTLSSSKPTRSGYSFLGWSTSSSASSASYSAGQSVSLSGNVTLYAVWEKTSTTPDPTPVPDNPSGLNALFSWVNSWATSNPFMMIVGYVIVVPLGIITSPIWIWFA